MAYKHAAKQVGRPMMGSAKGKALSKKSTKKQTTTTKTESVSPNSGITQSGSPKSGKKVGDVYKKIESNSSNKDIKLVATPKNNLTADPMPREDGFAYNKIAGAQMRGKAMTSDEMAAQQKGNPIMPEALKKNKDQYHTSGMPDFITSGESGKKMNTMNIDEGNFSKITTNIPERSKVTATEGSDKYFKGEEFFVDPAKMVAQHPSKQRMGNMVNKVAQYKMPNVKAAQKRNCKY